MTATSKGFASALLESSGARHARILGVGGYRPRRVVPNAEIVEAIDSSDEWIQERSGIKERRFAGEGESVVEMSVEAAKPALEMAGITADQLGAVIVATVTFPYQTPAAAPLTRNSDVDGALPGLPWPTTRRARRVRCTVSPTATTTAVNGEEGWAR